MKNKELKNILDQVTAGIRNEQVDAAAVDDATERVWAQLSVEADACGMQANRSQVASAAADTIEGCADFQSLIPAYLGGKLSEPRSLLLVDHTHECIPCRRALKQARETRVSVPTPARKQARKTFNYSLNPVVVRWGIAAVLVIGLGLVAWPLIQRYVPFGSFEATVQAADGPVYSVADSQTRAISAGEKLARNQVIRTAKDAHAVIRLGDGSTIEMKDRSEFSIDQTLRGTTIHLDRGSVIVEAAKQRNHLYVDTGDSLVSVTGTTFSANAGTKGSRVSVIEGEVHLDRAGQQRVLRAGEQATTSASIETIPIKDEVAWSRNAARYAKTLESLAALQSELNSVAKPGTRHSTRLLDMMPANTVLYAALPNLGATIAESHRIMQERIQQNPALREWFQNRGEAKGPAVDQAISVIKEFGEQLGDEIAVSAGMDDQGNPVGPIVLAELKNAAGFQAFFDSEVQKMGGAGKGPRVQWVDDPRTAQPAANSSGAATKDKELYVWINGDVLVASPKLDQLQSLAKGPTSGFAATPFYARVADVYREGAGLVVAADLEKIIAHTRGLRRIAVGDQHEQALTQLGVFNLKSFVLDQKDTDGKTHTRAVLSFNQADHGITSWLAAPAPMGSLEYISPDANLVAGCVVKNPTALVDDLLGALNTVCPDLNKKLDQLQTEHGLDVRKDFAAPLGGEYAFAIDGPILPTPSWKLIFEVNDPAHLQQTLERVVAEINKQAAKEGKNGLSLEHSDSAGLTFYTLKSKDFGLIEVNYTFSKGYMIVGPSRALIEQALSYHDSGTSLNRSAKFTAGLPADGNANFSALIYHNLAPLVQPFANQLGNSTKSLPDDQRKAITAMTANMQPTLAYAYAFGDRIEFASNTEGGPFGLSPATLLGMPNAFELEHILGQGMRQK
ncbi:MAG TPA: FecR domain-containing protein [Pyrinomonadaceae bacterium]|nr:FecR domain-containing protein [Pyrinomonadaceae bacterium]